MAEARRRKYRDDADPARENAVRRLDIRPFANGATAISAAPSRRAPTQSPCGPRRQRVATEDRKEPEDHGSQRDCEEAGGEQEIERSPVDQEADRREHRDDHGDARHDRVDHQPCLRKLVRGLQRRADGEERGRRREQPDEHDLAEEPRAVALRAQMIHYPLFGSAPAADKGDVTERILIVDDHPLTRDALAALLTQQGFEVVGDAASGEEAILAARSQQPDLVLLDLTMPGMDGLTALPKIRAEAPECEVVVLTASDAEENLLAAIRGGAAGYLLKTESPEQIATFLRGVVRGEAALSGGVARRLLDRVREGGRLDGIPEAITRTLSAREVEVLLLLDEHLGTDEIAQRLYISEHTVRSHVKSLLKKLGVSSRREALERLETARG